MSLEIKLVALAQAIGTDVKGLRNSVGTLANLTTTDKSNIVNAINEVKSVTTVNSAAIGGALNAIASAVGLVGSKSIVEALTELKRIDDAERVARGVADAVIQSQVTENDAYARSLIKDSAISGDLTHTYSADKILFLLTQAKADILGGIAPAALDTITELAAFLTDGGVAAGIVSQMANRVRVDAVQTFTSPQQSQARTNIGAASAFDLSTLTAAIGDTENDLSAIYAAAKV